MFGLAFLQPNRLYADSWLHVTYHRGLFIANILRMMWSLVLHIDNIHSNSIYTLYILIYNVDNCFPGLTRVSKNINTYFYLFYDISSGCCCKCMHALFCFCYITAACCCVLVLCVCTAVNAPEVNTCLITNLT